MTNDIVAIVQAGGAGSRMDVLTRERAKPALPFAGVHRLIDFPLSAIAHARIVDAWVSVQYQVASIDDYLSGGRPWSLDRNRGGFRRMVPQTGTGPPSEDGFAQGNADLLLRLRADIEAVAPEHLLVMSADHVFNADLRPIVDDHVASGRTATLLTSEISKKDAADNVCVLTDADGVVTEVQVKPARPATGVVSTEVFLYRTEPLLEALERLRARLAGEQDDDDSGLGDFGEHLLPELIRRGTVRAVPLPGYWRDLGQPHLYLQAHRDLLAGRVDVFDHRDRPVIAHWQDRPPARVARGAEVADSMLSPGAVVAGTVHRSVLGPGVVVERGATVTDSVLMDDVVVAAGSTVHTAIVDEGSRVEGRAVCGAEPTARVARDRDLVLIGRGSRVGSDVAAGARLEPGSTV